MKKAFTLIELLIVIAIIAILALIAIPNFLESQTRAKVSSVQANMRILATALESYYSDYNNYPVRSAPNDTRKQYAFFMGRFPGLSTPVAYLTNMDRVVVDPFKKRAQDDRAEFADRTIEYLNRLAYNVDHPVGSPPAGWAARGLPFWILRAIGPDMKGGPTPTGAIMEVATLDDLRTKVNAINDPYLIQMTYDPTNGTTSNGDIFRVGP